MTATFLIIYFCKVQVFMGALSLITLQEFLLCEVANIDLPSPGGPRSPLLPIGP